MHSLALFLNTKKEKVKEVAQKIIPFLEERHIKVLLRHQGAEFVNRLDLAVSEEDLLHHAEGVIVLGGDGTILSTARKAAGSGLPILGVNLGQLGFLTEVEVPNIFQALEKLLAGQYHIEERMMLEAQIHRQGELVDRYVALNDFVVAGGAFARMVNLSTHVNNQFVTNYPCDGIIVSSSTGSTAYSLSAGGPIVSPELELMIITPICPHTLYARPIIVSRDQSVRITVENSRGDIMLTLDGQEGHSLQVGDEIVIKKASVTARFLRLQGRSFYEVLHEKLREGGRSFG